MLSFYPGPSQVYPQVRQFLVEAYHSGILSANHRSSAFETLLQNTLTLLKKRLAIPADYAVFLVSSATECWEIIAQSLTPQKSLHLYQGEFGKKWCDYAAKIVPSVQGVGITKNFTFTSNILLPLTQQPDVVCCTHNETSNGTYLHADFVQPLHQLVKTCSPTTLLAFDATSSMAGLQLPFEQGDIWFASVQKCFGLPAGLAVLVCSPRTLQKAQLIADRKYYNSLLFIAENFANNQTTHTPNVLGIWLLNKILDILPPVAHTAQHLQQRADNFYAIMQAKGYKTLVSPLPSLGCLLSPTVLAFAANPDQLAALKTKTQQEGINIGNGYGKWKDNSFRIANFPALSDKDFKKLETVV